MSIHPTRLALDDDGRLRIEWSDGQTRRYAVGQLRDRCPCASCREKRRADAPASLMNVISPEEARPLKIEKMTPVGHYAYTIVFSDGHDTGIYTFETLRELGEPVASLDDESAHEH